MKKIKIIFIILLCLMSHLSHAHKIGFLVMATGKYIQWVSPLLDSARKYFCPNHEVTYFIFTDGTMPPASDVIIIHQERLGWPKDTLMRLPIYHKHADKLKKMDYLFACDADMRFVDLVGDEILSDLVATHHPGYVGKQGQYLPYERRKNSTAYVSLEEGKMYFAGGFNGGSSKEFLKMAARINEQIEKDFEKNYIAVWHDESHINRYFIDNPPTKILSPSYCYPESWNIPYEKRLLALDKNHAEMRK